MAGLNNGRRPPNVSQYIIATLNTVPTAQEVANQEDENFNLEDDLAIFTNTEFFNFDIGEDIEQPINYDPSQEERARRENATAHKKNVSNMEFGNTTYAYPMAPYLPPTINTSAAPASQTYPALPLSTTAPGPTYTTAYSAPPENNSISSMSPTSPTPDTPISRMAAEEDKRRRNTAASARFRVKKKQREQALERQAKDLADKSKALEDRVSKLETENEWLRALVVERDGRDGLEEGLEGWRRKRREDKGRVKDDPK